MNIRYNIDPNINFDPDFKNLDTYINKYFYL